MTFLWIYLGGLTVCILGGIVTALVEKRKFGERKVSATAWASIVLYSLWWPFIMLLNLICWPIEKFSKSE
ncbi:membrane protein [Streptomyces phage Patelgo]|nr:membrane protein [Streptomyces phage Patelgo]